MTNARARNLNFISVAFAASLGIGIGNVPALAADDDARQLHKAMSDYLASQKTVSASFDASLEAVTPDLEKIQFNDSGTLLLSRPDKVHATRTGGYADVELFFDGKVATVLGKNINKYIQLDAPGSIDQLIDTLRDHGAPLPGADLLLSNVYDTVIGDVIGRQAYRRRRRWRGRVRAPFLSPEGCGLAALGESRPDAGSLQAGHHQQGGGWSA